MHNTEECLSILAKCKSLTDLRRVPEYVKKLTLESYILKYQELVDLKVSRIQEYSKKHIASVKAQYLERPCRLRGVNVNEEFYSTCSKSKSAWRGRIEAKGAGFNLDDFIAHADTRTPSELRSSLTAIESAIKESKLNVPLTFPPVVRNTLFYAWLAAPIDYLKCKIS